MKLILTAFLICFFSLSASANTADVIPSLDLNEYLSPEKLEEILSKQNPTLDLGEPKWTIETHEGFQYLKGHQESNYGEGKTKIGKTEVYNLGVAGHKIISL